MDKQQIADAEARAGRRIVRDTGLDFHPPPPSADEIRQIVRDELGEAVRRMLAPLGAVGDSALVAVTVRQEATDKKRRAKTAIPKLTQIMERQK